MNRFHTHLRLRSLESRTIPSATPLGAEFRVNATTTNSQYSPKIAMDQDGDFVAVWDSDGQDNSGFAVYGQRYSADGTPQGAEFRVNTYTTNHQRDSVVAMDAAGNFVVAWSSKLQDILGYGVYAQRFNAAGVKQGTEFRVNTFTTGNQLARTVAMDQDGDFVIAWLSGSNQDGSEYGIFAQRYNAAGIKQGLEFRVNTFTGGSQLAPDIAMDQAGNFVVTWQSDLQDAVGNPGIYAQRFNATGIKQGSEFRVNMLTAGIQGVPSVAMDQDGDFVVAWHSAGQDGDSYGIMAQRFTAAGLGYGEFQVNTTTTSQQLLPSVAMDQDGDFVIAWRSLNQDGSNLGVYAQQFQANGAASGGEFRVNSYTLNAQNFPSLGMDADGDFVAAWHSNLQDGSGYGIYAQRYGLTPTTTTITGVQVNDGVAQRSRVTSLTVTFSTQVSFPVSPNAAFTLTRNSDGAPITLTATPTDIGGVTLVTLHNFTGSATESGSLADGRYTLTVIANQISSANGALDGNGDGTPGDPYQLIGAPGVTPNLFRFFGDADGDGSVGSADFTIFRPSFLGDNPIFDFDGDGSVSASDFIQFRLRFSGSI